MAGLNDSKRVIAEVHAGFVHAPEIQGLRETCIDACSTVTEYRTAIGRFQDTAHAMWTNTGSAKQTQGMTRPGWNTDREPPRTPRMGSAADVRTTPMSSGRNPVRNDPSQEPGRAFRRSRKCRNLPRCGDGEHWDDQCPLKMTASNEKREYLGLESGDAEEECAETESEYAAAQEAFYAARRRELDPMTNSVWEPAAEPSPQSDQEGFLAEVDGQPPTGRS